MSKEAWELLVECQGVRQPAKDHTIRRRVAQTGFSQSSLAVSRGRAAATELGWRTRGEGPSGSGRCSRCNLVSQPEQTVSHRLTRCRCQVEVHPTVTVEAYTESGNQSIQLRASAIAPLSDVKRAACRLLSIDHENALVRLKTGTQEVRPAQNGTHSGSQPSLPNKSALSSL